MKQNSLLDNNTLNNASIFIAPPLNSNSIQSLIEKAFTMSFLDPKGSYTRISR